MSARTVVVALAVLAVVTLLLMARHRLGDRITASVHRLVLHRLVAAEVRRRLDRIVTVVGEPPAVVVGAAPRPGAIARGALPDLIVTAAAVHVDTLPLHDVVLELHDMRVAPRTVLRRGGPQVVAGHGVLRGAVTGEEVRRRSGAPGMVRLTEGRAAVKLPGMLVGVRPVVEGDRVRLSPTPLRMSLPRLPDGVSLTHVDTHEDMLRITCTLDLPPLLNPS